MVVADKVLVELQAKVDQYNKNVNEAERNFRSKMNAIAASARRTEVVASAAFKGLVAGFVGIEAIRGAVQLVDAATRIENSLKVVGLAGAELERVYDGLYASAQRNMAPLETLTTLYSRLGLAQKELGVTNDDLLSFTDNVALALRVQGTTAQEARGALIQLSQALGSGVVRAEEFNSIVEGAPSILRAAAAGLEEAGGSVAKLRKLVLEGKVSSEAFFHAFQAGSVTLAEQVADAEVTVSQRFVRLQNVLIDVAREFNEGTNASELLGQGLSDLAVIVQDVAAIMQLAIGATQTLVGMFENGVGPAKAFANELARISGTEKFGAAAAKWINDLNIPGFSADSSAYGRVLTQTFELVGATPEDEALAKALAGGKSEEPLEITVKGGGTETVSLSDYKSPTTSSKKKSPAEKFGESLRDYQQRIDLLNKETELQSTLNPLVNDYGYQLEKLRATHELENAAVKAGLALDPERRKQIAGLAEDYATATAAAAKLAEAQNATVAQFEEIRDAARSALETIIDGFIEGKDAGEIFSDVLKDLGSQFLKMGLNSLFGGGSTPGSGIFGKLFGFADGGQVSGPGSGTSDSIPALLSNGEYVINARATRQNRALLDAINSGAISRFANGGMVGNAGASTSSGGIGPTYNTFNIDAKGAEIGVEQKIVRAIQQTVPGMIKAQAPAAVASAQRNRSIG